MLLGDDAGGSRRGNLKEIRFMIVLLGGGIYCLLALLWKLIYDFYMIYAPTK